jgi:ubiquinone/menaquinone biosynthesis C-methylase UbiE
MSDLASDASHWDERAGLDELAAVLDPEGSAEKNALIHHLQMEAIRNAGLSRTDDVLDYGCGTGRVMREFGASVRSIRGIDISERMVEQASRYGDARLYDGHTIPFVADSFDAVISVYVLQMYRENTRRFLGMLHELERVLRPDGRLVLVERVERTGVLSLDAWRSELRAGGFEIKRTDTVRSGGSRFALVHRLRRVRAAYADVLMVAYATDRHPPGRMSV